VIPDYSLLIALDREHLEEFSVSFPTWAYHKPELLDLAIVFVCDGDAGWNTMAWHLAIRKILDASNYRGIASVYFTSGEFASQREKMLTALVTIGPRYIETPYYFNLDCDCIATGKRDWIDSAWFTDSPAIIASAWGYTRPASMVADFDAWADRFPHTFGTEHTPHTISGNVARHKRIISYCMFGRTDWTRRMAELAGDRLPIPSQDTFLGMAAARNKQKIVKVRMSNHGWRHVGGGLKRLKAAAAEAMAGAKT
jgi:hypothetical protein